jgi:hypothetical protein
MCSAERDGMVSMHTGGQSMNESSHTRTSGNLSAQIIAGSWLLKILTCAALVVLAVGCTTSLIPGAEKVKVTKDPSLVSDCKSLGFVEAQPPFSTPNDARNEMKNKAAILGGNVLFVTNYSMKATGVAYSCDSTALTKIP